MALLPLYFLSGIFIPESEIPEGVLEFADLFPVRHFFEAFFAAYSPTTVGSGFEWGELAIVAALGRRRTGAVAEVLPLDATRLLIVRSRRVAYSA